MYKRSKETMTTTPDLTSSKPRHPAKFSDSVLARLKQMVDPQRVILDPFAGTGRIHELPCFTFGVEIEPEWASYHNRTLVGNALALPFKGQSFDAIITSPAYGNRMADSHNARDSSKRITYTHMLGRQLHPENSGKMQWGEIYRQFHANAWREAIRVLKPGGMFYLNVSDHIRKKEVMPVTDWHSYCLTNRFGLKLIVAHEIATPRMKFGENYDARLGTEKILVFSKPTIAI